MKKASRIMFTIGKVFNIISIVAAGILIILGIIITASGGIVGGLIGASETAPEAAEEAVPLIMALAGLFYLIFGLIFLGVNIAALIVLGKARKSVDAGSLETKPHVLAIVLGAFTNTFYILAGIFGLVARSQEIKAKENEGDSL